MPPTPATSSGRSCLAIWAKNLLAGQDFHPEGCISDWNDPGNVQYWRLCGGAGDKGLPDLDPNNWVVSQQQAYLKALKGWGSRAFGSMRSST